MACGRRGKVLPPFIAHLRHFSSGISLILPPSPELFVCVSFSLDAQAIQQLRCQSPEPAQ
jgi:hypothetical protein